MRHRRLCFFSGCLLIPALKPTLAYLLSALLLFQSFGRELLVVSYALNKARITARYCENKARPQLRCEGKCELARQLRRTEGSDQKSPSGAVDKVKFEVLPSGTGFSFAPPRRWRAAAPTYAPARLACYADAPAAGVFRPPLLAG